ncbi:MAG: helix-turn-helix transcriptional regulator [Lentisphaeria bacterium]|nr:helix-turn-helix transcriptional regulator [Lentisphaeria bacterium]
MPEQKELAERNRLLRHAVRGGIEVKLGQTLIQAGLVLYTLDHCGHDTFTHTHPHYEFSTLLTGRMRYCSAESEAVLDEASGAWILIAPELPHRRQTLADNSMLLGFTLTIRNPAPAFARRIRKKLQKLDGSAVTGAAGQIGKLAASGQPFAAERLRQALTGVLLDFFIRSFGPLLNGEPEDGNPGAALDLADYYIEENLLRNITADDIARHAGISRRHFYRLFTERHGIPPKEFIIRQRLERAAAALVSGNRPVKEIAELAGFRNLSYFTRQFRKAFTVPPARYRRNGG